MLKDKSSYASGYQAGDKLAEEITPEAARLRIMFHDVLIALVSHVNYVRWGAVFIELRIYFYEGRKMEYDKTTAAG